MLYALVHLIFNLDTIRKLNMKQIIIVGGGIGGLSTAIGFAQKGIRTVVLEKAAQFAEIGAGIQLGPNAFHALDYLGVGKQARSLSVYIENLRLMDALTGSQITEIPVGERFREKFHNPYVVIHRGDLYSVLLNACQNNNIVTLRSNSKVIKYRQSTDSVTAYLNSNEQIIGEALIGADGLWSTIRKQLVNDDPPRVSGHTTYRSVIPTKHMPQKFRWNAATLWAGSKFHIVHYPLSDWKFFNLVLTCDNNAHNPVVGKLVSKNHVLDNFQSVHPTVHKIINHDKEWKMWVLCDRDPIYNWVDGRVTLLGDAAHPMLQYLAQGACMALEDAMCLTSEFIDTTNVEYILHSYQKKRDLRTSRVQLQSREVGKHIYHPCGQHAMLRNAIMKSKTPEDWYNDMNWLYGSTGVNCDAFE